jgi:hypothetical protein
MLVRSVEACQTTVAVYLGDTWERVQVANILASDVGNSRLLSNFGLSAIDGYLVVFEKPPVQSRRSTRQGGFRRVSPAQ